MSRRTPIRKHSRPVTRAVAALLSATLAAGVLAGCAAWDEQTPGGDQELRDRVSQADGVDDPYALTGATRVQKISEVVPVTEKAEPTLPVNLTDADGYDVEVRDASRIVALDLYGTTTKTLTGLGLGDSIVGRSASSDEESLADVPEVTEGGHSINAEAVLNLKPTLLIVDHSIGPREAIDQIRDAGVDTVVLDPERDIDSIGTDIRAIAHAVGLPDEGEALAERSEEDLEKNRETVKGMTPERPMRLAFLYARGSGVFMILGPGEGTTDLIEAMGGVDASEEAGLEGSTPANAESLASLNPDAFIMMDKGFESAGSVDGILSKPGIAQTNAGAHSRVVTLPDGDSLAFGPQAGEVILRGATALYRPDALQ